MFLGIASSAIADNCPWKRPTRYRLSTSLVMAQPSANGQNEPMDFNNRCRVEGSSPGCAWNGQVSNGSIKSYSIAHKCFSVSKNLGIVIE